MPVGKATDHRCPIHGAPVFRRTLEEQRIDAWAEGVAEEAGAYVGRMLHATDVFANDHAAHGSNVASAEAQRAAWLDAIRRSEEGIRNPPTFQPREDVVLVPPWLRAKLVAQGWLTPDGKWTDAGLLELNRPVPPPTWPK